MRRIYFDNSATTKVCPEAAEIVMRVMTEDYGNPSSMHMAGVEAEEYIKDARAQIAATLHGKEKEIYFTSGGTESNNWAILGGAHARRRLGNRIITSKMEHPSVSEPVKMLEEEGFDVVRIGIDREGRLDMEALSEALTEDVILVTIMMVNNEIGAVADPAVIGPMVHAKSPNALYHVDAVQAYGKYDIRPGRWGIDLLSVSSHKIHGPKGVGFLYKKENVRILPLIRGGGQQDGLRSGTDNVPGIAGLGAAAKVSYRNLPEVREKLYHLKAYLREGLAGLDDVVVHGLPGEEGAPHIVNAAFLGVGAEVLLHALEDQGICISAGSACSTHKKTKSPTLSALGVSDAEMASSVRFSFSEENTTEEIDILLNTLRKILPVLRRYRAH